MDSSAPVDQHLELLTEHFGFNPKSFIDKLVYAANEHLYFLGDTLEKTLLDMEQLGKGPQGREQSENYERTVMAEKSTHKILTLFEHALDHMFDTIELWSLKSVFGITSEQASSFTLSHHRGLDLRRTGDGASHAHAQHDRLNRAEQRMRLKVAAAQAAGKTLDKAIVKVEERLSIASALQERYAHILTTSDTQGSLETRLDISLPPALKKVRADAVVLCDALSNLRDLDPLGKPLTQAGAHQPDDADRGFDGSDRDAYLHWEVKRALEGRAAGAEDAKGTEAKGTEAAPSRSAAKRKSVTTSQDSPPKSKRRGG